MGYRKLKSFRELDWSRRSPCLDCPFLRTSRFHEGIATCVESTVASIEMGRFVHSCHKTDNNPECDGPRNYKGDKPQHCAGAILMLLKTGDGADLQSGLLQAYSAGLIDLKAMRRRARKDKRVFTLKEFIKFNCIGALRKLGVEAEHILMGEQ